MKGKAAECARLYIRSASRRRASCNVYGYISKSVVSSRILRSVAWHLLEAGRLTEEIRRPEGATRLVRLLNMTTSKERGRKEKDRSRAGVFAGPVLRVSLQTVADRSKVCKGKPGDSARGVGGM